MTKAAKYRHSNKEEELHYDLPWSTIKAHGKITIEKKALQSSIK